MGSIHPEQRLLVARARLGDEQAFQWLVHHYTPRLLWFVQKIGLSPSNAEDVTQEVWLVVWSSLHRLRDVGKFRSWLYGIARNKALQFVSGEHDILSPDLEVASPVPDDSYFERYGSRLGQALDHLSSIHREILALRFLEGMSYEEISETTNVSAGTVKSRLHNAKLALRCELEEKADE